MTEGMSVAEQDFAAFYRDTFASLVAQLYVVTGDFTEAQEAAQEAYLRAWRDWRRVSDFEHPLAWVRLVGQRIAVSRWRRTRSAIRTWTRHGGPPDLPAPYPDSLSLVHALRQIPDAQRRAVVLHHMGGHSVAEIAAAEKVAEGTVKARLSRGRAALAVLLADTETDPTHQIGSARTEVSSHE